MTTLFSLILLPLRAPMVLLLLLVSTYLGLHWSRPGSWADSGMGGVTDLVWSAECLQALVVVMVCTLPDLLLRRISSIMAASRVASLVITLLLVITGGLYLLHLDVLTNVLILASTVLLARLDLVRLRVVTPPFVMTLVLSVLVLGGISLGRTIEVQLRPYVQLPQEKRAPAEPPAAGKRAPPPAPEAGAAKPRPEPPATRDAASVTEAPSAPRPPVPAASSGSPAAPRSAQAAPDPDGHPTAPSPDRSVPHLPENSRPAELP